MTVSLLITYRKRPQHLQQLLAALQASPPNAKVELLILEGDEAPTLSDRAWGIANVSYKYVPMSGYFHKTKLLNIGLAAAAGDLIIPYDVDLIPLNDAISVGAGIAESAPGILVTGYRLMSKWPHYDGNLTELTIAPEDGHSALKKQMTTHEKFGVCPIFNRKRLLDIGGWDERYIGWGAEDQDIIGRYLGDDIYLARFANLAYVHLDHDASPDWNDPQLLKQNRKIYYAELNSP